MKRDEITDLPVLGVLFDEWFPHGEERSFGIEKVYLWIVDQLHKIGVKMYPVLIEDFHRIHKILKKINGIFLTGGRDLDPKFYNQ